jgi:hypothetical protein
VFGGSTRGRSEDRVVRTEFAGIRRRRRESENENENEKEREREKRI